MYFSLCREDENVISTKCKLYRALDITIKQVQDELTYEVQSDSYCDLVDQRIKDLEENKKYKKCPNCTFLMDRNKRKCTQCQVSMSEFEKKRGKIPVVGTCDSDSAQKYPIHQFQFKKS